MTSMNDALPAVVQWHQEFRTAIFLSSLTLGTFLFTMKTFIIQTMKSQVYDDPAYQEQIRKDYPRERRGEACYGPLRRFSKLIAASIGLAFLNAALQITVGYLDSEWSAWACIVVFALSWGMVAVVLYLVSRNLQSMINRASENISE